MLRAETVKGSLMELAPATSLVITAHQEGPMLDACLASAARLQPAPLEVIVAVDGNARAVTAAVCKSGFRLVSLDPAAGVSAARNAGAQAARGDILIFVDSDIEMPPDFLISAGRAFARHPEASAIFGSYDDAPAAAGLVSRYRNLLHHYTHQHGRVHANTFWAGCGAIRSDAFRLVGGFNDAYAIPCVEDIELGYRLGRAAQPIRLAPDWQVKHLKAWQFRDLVLTDFLRRALPWSMLLRRERRIDNDLNLNWTSRLSAGLVCLALLALVVGLRWPAGLAVMAAALALATALNLPFYRFLASKQGAAFAILSIPLHWLYFLVGAAGFMAGMALGGKNGGSPHPARQGGGTYVGRAR